MTDGRVVFVGQAPSQNTDGLAPFSGRSGQRLAALSKIPHNDLGNVFELRNLFDRWPGKMTGKGDRFPATEARKRAMKLSTKLRGQRVVFVGHNVSKAFGVKVGQGALMTWLTVGHIPFRFAVIPHPSGVNRWWNNTANERAASDFLCQLVQGEPCAG
jgi:uracil-DNA glycosylase